MFVVVGMMVVAGLVGGAINYGLSEEEAKGRRSLGWCMFYGVGAALLMPLFLRTMDSALLTRLLGASSLDADALVFFAFCLLAAISSRKFIETLSSKLWQRYDHLEERSRKAEEEIKKNTEQSKAALAANALGTGRTAPAPSSAGKSLAATAPAKGSAADDPWKGAFGGKSAASDRVLEAAIDPVPESPGIYLVQLSVRSTKRDKPLTGEVLFFLHPTFKVEQVGVKPDADGVARLNLTAWGAFTVGALADGGATKLELDLAKHPDADAEFKAN